MNAKILLILLSSLALFGCEHKLNVFSTSTPKTALSISKPVPAKLLPVRWVVVTPENAEAVFKTLKESNVSGVVFGLTDDNYENLAANLANLRKYITEQGNVLDAYKLYYEPQNETDENTK